MVIGLVITALPFSSHSAEINGRTTLWYDRPGEKWSDSLPIGNGRMGAMMHGDPARDVFYLNEETVWSGGPHDYTNAGSFRYLEKLRRLIRDGKYDEAAKFGAERMLGIPRSQQGYQSLGKLFLNFDGHASYSNYHRQLDMSQGMVEIQYQVDDAVYTRKILASHPDQVIAIQLDCDLPGRITFETCLSTEHEEHGIKPVGSSGLAIEGMGSTRNGIEGAIRFRCQLHVTTKGGSGSLEENRIRVTNADAATLLIAAATNHVD